VPLDPSTAWLAKNSPGRKEKHPGKTSLLGRCVGLCHRGGKQPTTHSEREFETQKPGFSLRERQQTPSRLGKASSAQFCQHRMVSSVWTGRKMQINRCKTPLLSEKKKL